MTCQAGRDLERLKSIEAARAFAVGHAQGLALRQHGPQHVRAKLADDFTTGEAQQPAGPVIPGHDALFAVDGERGIGSVVDQITRIDHPAPLNLSLRRNRVISKSSPKPRHRALA
ncbi:MAG: hypothetical protein QF398_11560 [Alphaproteobacteria bacterium]|jgi:hypothetical protein|nr:hypothetical protein [Alphaproteobacteria bacterium]MEE1556825.1 hypothetical protein [Alphaproteobacteria bacterium]|tara:strand:- start:335 stop:679 length:345 start_codon:yes stop_codon:yes gene_type:complete